MRLVIEPRFWQSRSGIELYAALFHWTIRDWLAIEAAPTTASYPATLRLSARLWRELGEPFETDPSEAEFRSAQIELLSQLFQWPVAQLHLTTNSFVSAPGLQFELRWNGRDLTPFPPSVLLPFVESRGVALHPAAFVLHEMVDSWNRRASSTRAEQLQFLASVKRMAESLARAAPQTERPVTLELHEHLAGLEILEPAKVALSWDQPGGSLLSLRAVAVTADGTEVPLPLSELDGQHPVVALEGNQNIVLDQDTAAILRHVRRHQQRRTRKEAARGLVDPASVLPPGLSPEKIDLSQYSSRVLSFAPIVRAERAIDIRSSGLRWYETDGEGEPFFDYLIASSDPGVPEQRLRFGGPEEVESFLSAVDAELKKPTPGLLQQGGVSVYPTLPLFHALATDLAACRRSQSCGHPEESVAPPPTRLGVVLSDELPAAAALATASAQAVPWPVLEGLLQPGTALKRHQRDGVEWLWSHARSGTPGVLLADDMGLGKTLQIAAFLALRRHIDSHGPSLVVCPVMLLANWREELERFFRPEVFPRTVVLYDAELRRRKRSDGTIDVTDLPSCSLVLTNYETLQTHQVSLLSVSWDVAVLDEAHEIKNPHTYKSKAARGLKQRFAICSTGTPVENQLSDLWTLYDFLGLSRLFGKREEFVREYEVVPDGATRARVTLGYPGARSTLLRRTKSEVLDLEPKHTVQPTVAMTEAQLRQEQRLTAPGRSAFDVLRDLQMLYEHPWLLRKESELEDAMPSIEVICEASPKLQLCIDLLDEIRARGEKALVFTLWTRMQALLQYVLKARFNLPRVHLINGATNRRRGALDSIRDFSSSRGFDVLVLSPRAAGVGLNIVAANHVIHYGRWWNPAKEDQATDRAYRIGQDKPVTVYYPLLHRLGDPTSGFDVKLHELSARKRALASDFLTPQDAYEPTEAEVASIFSSSVQDSAA